MSVTNDLVSMSREITTQSEIEDPLKDLLEEPGLNAKVSKGTRVYGPKARTAKGNKSEEYFLGTVPSKTRVVYHENGGDWVRITFEEKTKDGGQVTYEEKPIKLGTTQNEVREGWVKSNKLSNQHITQHGKVTSHQETDLPVFRTGKNGPEVSPQDVKQGGIGDCMLMAALCSVAAHDPKAIFEMVEDRGSSVGVQLYTPNNGPRKTFVVSKKMLHRSKMFGDDELALAHGDALWPGLIEKAIAKMLGTYHDIAPGTYNVHRTITGVQTNSEMLFGQKGVNGLPSKQTMKQKYPLLAGQEFNQDWKDWDHFKGNGLADEEQANGNFDPTLKDIESYLERAKVSKRFKRLFLSALRGEDLYDGKVGSGEYSERTLKGWERINQQLDEGEYLYPGTRNTGRKGKGHSGGEDMSKVSGLAFPHAYSMIGTKTEQNSKGKDVHYLKMRNPWGHTGMKYSSSHKRSKQKDPEFWVELSDLRRFFGASGKTGIRWTFSIRSLGKVVEDSEAQLKERGQIHPFNIKALKAKQAKAQEEFNENKLALPEVEEKLHEAELILAKGKSKIEALNQERTELLDEVERNEKKMKELDSLGDKEGVRELKKKNQKLSDRWEAAYDEFKKLDDQLDPIRTKIQNLQGTVNGHRDRLESLGGYLTRIETLLSPKKNSQLNRELDSKDNKSPSPKLQPQQQVNQPQKV